MSSEAVTLAFVDATGAAATADGVPARPVTRADCENGPRPCPWVSCTEHALLGALTGMAPISDEAALARLETMPWSCVLDAADASAALPGAVTLEDVGDCFNVTRERVRQLESAAKKKARFPARVAGLEADAVEETPDALAAGRARREGSHGGAARPWEPPPGPTLPPAHLAHLPGPAEVSAGETFWCGRLNAPVGTRLCVGRHTAKTRVHASFTANTYRACAECPDGAALLARLGASATEAAPLGAPVRPRRHLIVLPHAPAAPTRGLLDTPASNDTPETRETPMETTTQKAPEKTPEAPTPETHAETKTAKPARCDAKGCKLPHAQVRTTTAPEIASFCGDHRIEARDWAKGGLVTLAEAAAALRAGTRAKIAANAAKARAERPRSSPTKRRADVAARASVEAASVATPVPSDASTSGGSLVGALATARRHAVAIGRLGGVEAAESLAAIVEASGGVGVVVEALTMLRGLGGAQ